MEEKPLLTGCNGTGLLRSSVTLKVPCRQARVSPPAGPSRAPSSPFGRLQRRQAGALLEACCGWEGSGAELGCEGEGQNWSGMPQTWRETRYSSRMHRAHLRSLLLETSSLPSLPAWALEQNEHWLGTHMSVSTQLSVQSWESQNLRYPICVLRLTPTLAGLTKPLTWVKKLAHGPLYMVRLLFQISSKKTADWINYVGKMG